MTEDELDRRSVERCLAGDADAFGALIERYERPVFNAILNMVGDWEDARELCQQVFMNSFVHLRSYDTKRRFFSWIYRMAMNAAINHLNSKRWNEPLADTMEHHSPNPEQRAEATERQQRLRRALGALDPKYRSVVVMKHLGGLSYHEIAEVLALPEKTVKSRLFTARQLLRDELEERPHATTR